MNPFRSAAAREVEPGPSYKERLVILLRALLKILLYIPKTVIGAAKNFHESYEILSVVLAMTAVMVLISLGVYAGIDRYSDYQMAKRQEWADGMGVYCPGTHFSRSSKVAEHLYMITCMDNKGHETFVYKEE